MQKRIFDIIFSLLGLFVLWPFICLLLFLSAIDTRSSGVFLQQRIGRKSKIIKIIKLRTLEKKSKNVSKYGMWIRKNKLDELPQLINVLLGQMSIVGPRPDINGYYNLLTGEDRKILELRPGITSPAAIKYYHENAILLKQEDPLKYNDQVIFPDKVKMNLNYYKNNSILGDIKIIGNTIIKVLKI